MSTPIFEQTKLDKVITDKVDIDVILLQYYFKSYIVSEIVDGRLIMPDKLLINDNSIWGEYVEEEKPLLLWYIP